MRTKALDSKRLEYQTLCRELEGATKTLDGDGLSETQVAELEEKTKRLEAVEAELAALERADGVLQRGREVADPVLPTAHKSRQGAPEDPRTVGTRFVESKEFTEFVSGGIPDGVPSRKFWASSFEQKATLTYGTGVIQPSRDPDAVRGPAMDALRIRDVLNVGSTDSNGVSYILVDPGTPVAAPVAEGAVKPEASIGLTEATAPVRTIAAWTPISEQALQDVGNVRSIVDGELVYQVNREEENQLVWGGGTGQNLLGIVNTPNVQVITGGTTLLDRIRVGITMVRKAGGDPNGVLLHPDDAEAIALLKATTNEYIAPIGVVYDGQTGRLRLWGLPVVETMAMKSPAATTRNMIVGDFRRGATLWDRQQVSVEIGWQGDQFIRNLRSIRAEERLAFAVKRPAYFARYVTAA